MPNVSYVARLFALKVKCEFGEVHEVPGVDDLTIPADDEGRAEEGRLPSAGGKTQSVAGVNTGTGPTHGDAIIFGYELVEVDMNVAERVIELAVDSFETLGTDEDRVSLGKTVDLALRVKEFVDGRFFTLVPDLFKPELSEGLVLRE
jgi:hypothetical protein